jgi:hypothetical protein
MSYNPVEDAYKAGKDTITNEQAVGLRGGKLDEPPKKKKKSVLARLAKYAMQQLSEYPERQTRSIERQGGGMY